jgi:hypothetical protein
MCELQCMNKLHRDGVMSALKLKYTVQQDAAIQYYVLFA